MCASSATLAASMQRPDLRRRDAHSAPGGQEFCELCRSWPRGAWAAPLVAQELVALCFFECLEPELGLLVVVGVALATRRIVQDRIGPPFADMPNWQQACGALIFADEMRIQSLVAQELCELCRAWPRSAWDAPVERSPPPPPHPHPEHLIGVEWLEWREGRLFRAVPPLL